MNTFKKFKFLSIGIIIGIILSIALPVLAQEFSLTNSEWKIMINGNEIKNDLPILLMQPGYNYIPAGLFRDICKEINVDFVPDPTTKEIRLTIKEPKIISLSTQEITSFVIPTPTPEITQINKKGDENTMNENVNLITNNPMRNQEPYSSVDKTLIENSTYNNFDVIKYNDNFFIAESNAESFFKKEFKYSLSKGTLRLANVDTYERVIIEENIGYIIIDYVIYFNVNLEI